MFKAASSDSIQDLVLKEKVLEGAAIHTDIVTSKKNKLNVST